MGWQQLQCLHMLKAAREPCWCSLLAAPRGWHAFTMTGLHHVRSRAELTKLDSTAVYVSLHAAAHRSNWCAGKAWQASVSI